MSPVLKWATSPSLRGLNAQENEVGFHEYAPPSWIAVGAAVITDDELHMKVFF